ncbi:unnamed protein product, partial [Prorocentrum cordatum]
SPPRESLRELAREASQQSEVQDRALTKLSYVHNCRELLGELRYSLERRKLEVHSNVKRAVKHIPAEGGLDAARPHSKCSERTTAASPRRSPSPPPAGASPPTPRLADRGGPRCSSVMTMGSPLEPEWVRAILTTVTGLDSKLLTFQQEVSAPVTEMRLVYDQMAARIDIFDASMEQYQTLEESMAAYLGGVALFAWVAVIAPSLSGWLAGSAAGRSAPAGPGRAAAVDWCWEPPPWDCSCSCTCPSSAAPEPPAPPPLGASVRLAPDGAAAIEVVWPWLGGLAVSPDLALAGCLGFGIFELLVSFVTDPGFRHERVIVWPCHEGSWIVYTGGGDLYVEEEKDWDKVCLMTAGQPPRSLPDDGAKVVQFARFPTDDELRGLIAEARAEVASLRESEPDRGVPSDPTYFLSEDGRQHPLLRRRLQGKQVRRAGREGNPPVADAGAAAAESHGGAEDVGGDALAADGERHRWLVSEPGLVWELGTPVPHASVMIRLGDRGVADINGVTVPAQSVPEAEVGDYASMKTSAYEVAIRDADGTPTDFGRRVGIVPSHSPSHGEAAKPTAPVEATEPGDVRTLWVDTDAMNVRFKSRRNVVMESYPTVWTDSPVEGPSSVMYILSPCGSEPATFRSLPTPSRLAVFPPLDAEHLSPPRRASLPKDRAVGVQIYMDPPSDLSPKEAFQGLLRGRGVYDTETAYTTLAPYQRGAVSLPCDVSTAPAVGTLVTGRALEYLVEAEEQMIRTDAEVQLDRETNGEIKTYTDPLLANSRRRYSTFVKDLKRKGLVGFTRDPKEFVGVFFVWKKERASMRTFHRMMFGNHLSKYFCYPGGLAKEFGIVGQVVEGVSVRADDYLWPCALALPMGWTWSLYFAQVANLGLVERVPALTSSCVATDRGPPIVLTPTSSWHYVYVDNVGLLSLDASYVKGALADTIAAFDAAGLIMHDISVDSDIAEALGVTLDGRKHQTLVNHRRYWKVRLALRWALSLRRLAGRELEVLLGHCTFVGLMCRETLSVRHTVYTFIRERYWAKSDVWDSARQELECFLGLMPLLRSEWDRPWLAQVLSVDASPYGWGIASSEFGESTVKKQGRILERSRFRRLGGLPARASALAAAGFVYSPTTARWQVNDEKERDPSDVQEAGAWEMRKDFPEIPGALLHGDRWRLILHGKWAYSEDILILEARVLVKAVARVCNCVPGGFCRVLLLGDNMSVILACERFRARSFGLLVQIRRIAAYALARGVRFGFRWHPSELNSSDAGSRIYDPNYDSTKDLTRLVADGHGPGEVLPQPADLPRSDDVVAQDPGSLDTPDPFACTVFHDCHEADPHPGGAESQHRGPEEPAHDDQYASDGDFLSAFSDPGAIEDTYPPATGDSLEAGYLQLAETLPPQSSVLEEMAVSVRTQRQYVMELQGFVDFAYLRQLRTATSALLDAALVEYMNHMFFRGEQAFRGEKLLAAVMARSPEFSRVGISKMPRAWRCLKGWRRLTPGRSRKPAPLPVWCGIAVEFARRGMLAMGLAVMIGVSCYLRPSELLNLTSDNLVAPASPVSQYWSLLLHPSEGEKRSKTGDADDSLIIDSAYMLPWVHDFLQALKDKGGRLWSFDYLTFLAEFKTVAKMLGMPHLVPYQMRHSGPSIDRLKPDRSQEECQKRGRWKSWKSLVRYEKSARLGSFWNELPADIQAHMRLCEDQLVEFLWSPERDGTYMADLFSGSGKVARAVMQLGFSAKAWDIIHGPHHDITDPAVLRLLLSDIRDGKVFAAMIALP